MDEMEQIETLSMLDVQGWLEALLACVIREGDDQE
jgi:hypothetical protein